MKFFGLFRITFGLYLLWHFSALIPYGKELFTNQGVISHANNPFFGKWPNPLFLPHSEALVTPLLLCACVCSFLFMLGVVRRFSSFVLWFILTCTFTANPLIANPSLAYVGIILLFCSLITNGESYQLRLRKRYTLPLKTSHWRMPYMIRLSAWVLLATGYSFSGYLKLSSPSWLDGSALSDLLSNPLARPSIIRDFVLLLPAPFLLLGTWATLLLELLYVPLAIFKKTRPWIWLSLLLMHLGIIVLVDFADLSLGMIFIHLFTTPHYFFRYFSALPSCSKENHILFIDGECILCQSFSRVLLINDQKSVFNFAPLQGVSASRYLPHSWKHVKKKDGTATGSIALITHPNSKHEQRYQGADALLHTLRLMGGPLVTLFPLIYAPSCIKAPLYQIIARHRHHLALFLPKNTHQTCPLLKSEERLRFLP